MKHTPGPWRIEQGIYIMPPENSTQFSICKMGGIQREESRKANARLIAAAPDLLAAAKRAQELISSAIDLEYVSGKPGDPAAVIWRELDAAIAKAEGRK